jgi:hypothetical protein
MKITIDRSVLEQALDALERPRNTQSWYQRSCDDAQAAKALREALAQPAAQPTNCRHCGGPETVLCGGQCKPAAQPTIDLSRLDPFVGGLGKAILQELKESLAAQPAAQQEHDPFLPTGARIARGMRALAAAQQTEPQKTTPSYIDGYNAGMADAKRMAQQEPAGEPVAARVVRRILPEEDETPAESTYDVQWIGVDPFKFAGDLFTRPAVPLTDEREAFVLWLSTTYPRTFTVEDAEHKWKHEHVAALAWKKRATIAHKIGGAE